MIKPKPLPVSDLYQSCNPAQFDFETTAELSDLEEIIGQERAVDAIRFGIGIVHEGFNLFALGPNGTGKHTAVSQFLSKKAPAESTPSEWCYINNFSEAHKPRALRLPPGQAAGLRGDMQQLVEDLGTVLPAAFSSDEYKAQKQAIEEELKEKQTQALEELKSEALTHHIALIRTPSGFAFAPMKDGEVLQPDEYMRLSTGEQESIERDVQTLQNALQRVMEQVPQWRRESQKMQKQLDREVAGYAVAPLFAELRQKYEALPAVLAYLDGVDRDVTEHFDQFG